MKENRYTMPQQFIDDANVALKWKLYAYLNGFWIGGKTVYARNDTLAKEFNKSERAIQFALGELEELGLITRNIKGLSRFILPGGIPKEGRSPASPTHEAQLHQRDEAQLHHTSDIISDIKLVAERDLEREEKKPKPKYNNARVAFDWLPNRQKSWDRDLTQLECGLLLYERGEEAVRKFVAYVKNHEDDEGFNWVFVKPSDYERKWEDIKAYAKRNR